jgi:hypothetical protein
MRRNWCRRARPSAMERGAPQAVAASGVSTEWGAGLPVFHSADGMFSFKPRGRILTDVSTTTGSKYSAATSPPPACARCAWA